MASNDLVLRLVKPQSAVLHKSRLRYLDTKTAAEGREARREGQVTAMGTAVAEITSKWAGHTQSSSKRQDRQARGQQP